MDIRERIKNVMIDALVEAKIGISKPGESNPEQTRSSADFKGHMQRMIAHRKRVRSAEKTAGTRTTGPNRLKGGDFGGDGEDDNE